MTRTQAVQLPHIREMRRQVLAANRRQSYLHERVAATRVPHNSMCGPSVGQQATDAYAEWQRLSDAYEAAVQEAMRNG